MGASAKADRATQASPQAPAGLGHSVSIPCAAPPAGAIATAKRELDRLRDLLGDENFGCSRVSIVARDLAALVSFAEQIGGMLNIIGEAH